MKRHIFIPKSDAACADLLYQTRESRHKLQREVDKHAELESVLTEHFVNKMSKGQTGVAGKVALVQIVTSAKPIVEDWDKFYAHIKKTGEFELMQRRVNEGSVNDRWENKKQVPGIGRMQVKKVSCTKLKK